MEIPPGWKKTVMDQDILWTHPESNMDVASLPSDFFQNLDSFDQALELIWLNGLANLSNTNNEIIIPFRVIRHHGQDLLRQLTHRLGNHLNAPVVMVPDVTLRAVRIRPLGPRVPLPIDIHTHKLLKVLVESAAKEGVPIPLEPARIPRPPNSFILYRQHHHQPITAANPGVPNTQISRIIGNMWRNEAPEVRNNFKELAEEKKRLHAKAYPNYQYSPRRPSEKVRRTTKGHINLMPWLNHHPLGQKLVDDAANNTEGYFDIDEDFIDAIDALGLLNGPNGVAPIPHHDHSDILKAVAQQLDERVVLEPVRWEPLQGNEFDDTFPMDELLNLEGA